MNDPRPRCTTGIRQLLKVSLAHHGVFFLDELPRSSKIPATQNGASVLDFTRLAILAAPAAWIAGVGARHVCYKRQACQGCGKG